jgi:hypothetical protein
VVSDWKGTKMRDDSFSSESLESTERETNWLGIYPVPSAIVGK